MAWFALVLALAAPHSSVSHVRSTEPRILALIEEGTGRSKTFRRLVETLETSDVMVYVEPKMTRGALGGFLVNDISGGGGWRYLRIALEFRGSHRRVIALLAHELQHAVEIAQAPAVHDAESLQREFSRRAVKFGCSGECYETQAAKDVEHVVLNELAFVLTD